MTKVAARTVLEMLIRLPYLFCLGIRGIEAINVFHVLSGGLAERMIPLIVAALFVLSVLVVLLRLDKNLLPWEIGLEASSASASVQQAWHFSTTTQWPFAVDVYLRFAVLLMFLALLQVAIHFASKRAPAVVEEVRRRIGRLFPGIRLKSTKGSRQKKHTADKGAAQKTGSRILRKVNRRNKAVHSNRKPVEKH